MACKRTINGHPCWMCDDCAVGAQNLMAAVTGPLGPYTCAGGSSTIDAPVKAPNKVPFSLGKSKGNDYDQPYKVVLWNDPVTPMDKVIEILVRVFEDMDLSRAYLLMMTAHTNGSVIVGTYPKERAEMYREGLENARLTATIEKA